MRRLKRAAFALAALLCVAVVAGLIFERWARWYADRHVQPIGDFVEIDGRRSHIVCTGEGSPTVVLESGMDFFGSLAWYSVQPSLAELTRVCSYDRAGILLSEGMSGPVTAVGIVEQLHAVLSAIGEPPPYVMVGHSLGGMLVRVYADRYGEEVVGLVFVDSGHPEQRERLPAEPSILTAWIPRLVAATGALRFVPTPNEWLPNEHWRTVRRHLGPSIESTLKEVAALSDISERDLVSGPFDSLPLVVLTSGMPARSCRRINERASTAFASRRRESWQPYRLIAIIDSLLKPGTTYRGMTPGLSC